MTPNISPMTSLAPQLAGFRQSESREDFAAALARAPASATDSREQRARDGAEQLVAVALVQPLLKQLRESNNAAAPFAPTSGERSFRSLMDAALAQRMVRSQSWPLVDHLARGMLSKPEAQES
jgi:Rod binding domain-containing protein